MTSIKDIIDSDEFKAMTEPQKVTVIDGYHAALQTAAEESQYRKLVGKKTVNIPDRSEADLSEEARMVFSNYRSEALKGVYRDTLRNQVRENLVNSQLIEIGAPDSIVEDIINKSFTGEEDNPEINKAIESYNAKSTIADAHNWREIELGPTFYFRRDPGVGGGWQVRLPFNTNSKDDGAHLPMRVAGAYPTFEEIKAAIDANINKLPSQAIRDSYRGAVKSFSKSVSDTSDYGQRATGGIGTLLSGLGEMIHGEALDRMGVERSEAIPNLLDGAGQAFADATRITESLSNISSFFKGSAEGAEGSISPREQYKRATDPMWFGPVPRGAISEGIGQALTSIIGGTALTRLGGLGNRGVAASLFGKNFAEIGENEIVEAEKFYGMGSKEAFWIGSLSAAAQAPIETAADMLQLKILSRDSFKVLNDLGLAKKLGSYMFINGVSEGTQEALQGIISNGLAKKFYDENRQVFAGIESDAAVGFIIGTMFGTLGGFAGGPTDGEIRTAVAVDTDQVVGPDPVSGPQVDGQTGTNGKFETARQAQQRSQASAEERLRRRDAAKKQVQEQKEKVEIVVEESESLNDKKKNKKKSKSKGTKRARDWNKVLDDTLGDKNDVEVSEWVSEDDQDTAPESDTEKAPDTEQQLIEPVDQSKLEEIIRSGDGDIKISEIQAEMPNTPISEIHKALLDMSSGDNRMVEFHHSDIPGEVMSEEKYAIDIMGFKKQFVRWVGASDETQPLPPRGKAIPDNADDFDQLTSEDESSFNDFAGGLIQESEEVNESEIIEQNPIETERSEENSTKKQPVDIDDLSQKYLSSSDPENVASIIDEISGLTVKDIKSFMRASGIRVPGKARKAELIDIVAGRSLKQEKKDTKKPRVEEPRGEEFPESTGTQLIEDEEDTDIDEDRDPTPEELAEMEQEISGSPEAIAVDRVSQYSSARSLAAQIYDSIISVSGDATAESYIDRVEEIIDELSNDPGMLDPESFSDLMAELLEMSQIISESSSDRIGDYAEDLGYERYSEDTYDEDSDSYFTNTTSDPSSEFINDSDQLQKAINRMVLDSQIARRKQDGIDFVIGDGTVADTMAGVTNGGAIGQVFVANALDGNLRDRPASEVFDDAIKMTPDNAILPWMKAIVERVSPNLRIITANEDGAKRMYDIRVSGIYNTQSGSIVVPDPLNETGPVLDSGESHNIISLIHETFHHLMTSPSDAATEYGIRDLMDQTRFYYSNVNLDAYTRKYLDYALSAPWEFVAVGMSDPHVQKLLAAIPAPRSSSTNKPKTMLGMFLNAIYKNIARVFSGSVAPMDGNLLQELAVKVEKMLIDGPVHYSNLSHRSDWGQSVGSMSTVYPDPVSQEDIRRVHFAQMNPSGLNGWGVSRDQNTKGPWKIKEWAQLIATIPGSFSHMVNNNMDIEPSVNAHIGMFPDRYPTWAIRRSVEFFQGYTKHAELSPYVKKFSKNMARELMERSQNQESPVFSGDDKSPLVINRQVSDDQKSMVLGVKEALSLTPSKQETLSSGTLIEVGDKIRVVESSWILKAKAVKGFVGSNNPQQSKFYRKVFGLSSDEAMSMPDNANVVVYSIREAMPHDTFYDRGIPAKYKTTNGNAVATQSRSLNTSGTILSLTSPIGPDNNGVGAPRTQAKKPSRASRLREALDSIDYTAFEDLEGVERTLVTGVLDVLASLDPATVSNADMPLFLKIAERVASGDFNNSYSIVRRLYNRNSANELMAINREVGGRLFDRQKMGSITSKLSPMLTRLNDIAFHPRIKRWLSDNFGYYIGEGWQLYASSYRTHKLWLQEMAETHGINTITDPDSTVRMGIVSILAQTSESVTLTDNIASIERSIANMARTGDNMIIDKSKRANAIFSQLIAGVDATDQDKAISQIIAALPKNERDVYIATLNRFADMSGDMFAVSNIMYGKPYEKWNNWVRRQAENVSWYNGQEIMEMDDIVSYDPDKEFESDFTPNRPINAVTSVLEERIGLGADSFYNMDFFSSVDSAFKLSEYEINTAAGRLAIFDAFHKNGDMREAFESIPEGTNARDNIFSIFRRIHSNEISKAKPLNFVASLVMDGVTQSSKFALSSVKNFFAQSLPMIDFMGRSSVFEKSLIGHAGQFYFRSLRSDTAESRFMERAAPEIMDRARVMIDLGYNDRLPDYQQRLKHAVRGRMASKVASRYAKPIYDAVDNIVRSPQWIPDAMSSRGIFFMKYLNELRSRGVISGYSDWNERFGFSAEPDMRAAAAASRYVDEINNSPSIKSFRGELFTVKSPSGRFFAEVALKFSQTTSSMASNNMLYAKEAYGGIGSKDPEVREQAIMAARSLFSNLVVQAMMFPIIGAMVKYAAYPAFNAMAALLRGVDDEEEDEMAYRNTLAAQRARVFPFGEDAPMWKILLTETFMSGLNATVPTSNFAGINDLLYLSGNTFSEELANRAIKEEIEILKEQKKNAVGAEFEAIDLALRTHQAISQDNRSTFNKRLDAGGYAMLYGHMAQAAAGVSSSTGSFVSDMINGETPSASSASQRAKIERGMIDFFLSIQPDISRSNRAVKKATEEARKDILLREEDSSIN